MILTTGVKFKSQWLTGIAVLALVIQFGYICGWTSPAMAQLSRPDSPVLMSAAQASWVAALLNLGRLVGAISGPVAASWLGSKHCILVCLLPLSIGWLLVGLSRSVGWLYVARVLGGTGYGMAFGTFPLYLGEVAVPELRGALISLAIVGAPIGQVLASLCGSYLSVLVCGYIYLAHTLLLVLAFTWLPDSPHHLVKLGRLEAARDAISWYRSGKGVEEELAAVEKFVATDAGRSFASKLQESLVSAHVRRAGLQIVVLFVFMQISGLNSILFYMESILRKAQFDLVEPSLAVVGVNVFGILATALSVFLIDRCGRKFLLLLSSAGVSLSMAGFTVYFLLMEAQPAWIVSAEAPSFLRWLPALSLVLFIVSFCLGLLPVPSTILGETFPADIKCVAACISGVTAAVIAFVSTKTYQPMVDCIGEAYVFLIYGILAVMVIPYTLIFVMETKGKSLQQIQDKLMNK